MPLYLTKPTLWSQDMWHRVLRSFVRNYFVWLKHNALFEKIYVCRFGFKYWLLFSQFTKRCMTVFIYNDCMVTFFCLFILNHSYNYCISMKILNILVMILEIQVILYKNHNQVALPSTQSFLWKRKKFPCACGVTFFYSEEISLRPRTLWVHFCKLVRQKKIWSFGRKIGKKDQIKKWCKIKNIM